MKSNATKIGRGITYYGKLVAGAGFGSHIPVLGPSGHPLRWRRHFAPGKMVNLVEVPPTLTIPKIHFLTAQLCERLKSEF